MDIATQTETPSAPPNSPIASAATRTGRSLYLWAAAFAAALLTRLPIIHDQLYSFDAVNLALALNEFDPLLNQPQPPGYPVFVLLARALYPLFDSPESTFAALQALVSGLSLVVLCLLTTALYSARTGFIACALFLFNPVFWYSGITSPLRPHLALLPILFAYLCWRAMEDRRWYFLLASFTLGLAGGIRPELTVILFPLWLWTGWRCGDLRLLLQGLGILAVTVWIWLANLAMASGGFGAMMEYFQEYLSTQTFQTSVLQGAPPPGWRRMMGRVVVWTSLGALPWLWTVPFGWRGRNQGPAPSLRFGFLALWFLPAIALNAILHSADPDHVLASIPVICILGARCLEAAEQRLDCRWWQGAAKARNSAWAVLIFSLAGMYFIFPDDKLSRTGLVVWFSLAGALLMASPLRPYGRAWPLLTIALLGNILLFFGKFPFPEGPGTGGFRGLASLYDAFLGGRYESSFDRVRWTAERMADAATDVPRIEAASSHPAILVWSRDAEPSWRKLTYYFPTDKVYVLDELGDPGVTRSQAVLWSGNKPSARFSGPAPIRLPVPRQARLIWFVAGGRIEELAQISKGRKALGFVHADLPADSPGLRWGSFEFVPQ